MTENIINPPEYTVFIVDDTFANIDVLRKTLEPEKYNIAFAPSGEIALKIIPDSMPDLILMDVMMPGIDENQIEQIYEFINSLNTQMLDMVNNLL